MAYFSSEQEALGEAIARLAACQALLTTHRTLLLAYRSKILGKGSADLLDSFDILIREFDQENSRVQNTDMSSSRILSAVIIAVVCVPWIYGVFKMFAG